MYSKFSLPVDFPIPFYNPAIQKCAVVEEVLPYNSWILFVYTGSVKFCVYYLDECVLIDKNGTPLCIDIKES